jgi:ribosomal protein S18 acetylase RimI-like enzyme
LASGLAPGYVWEEGGRIVGNVSLLRAKTRGRYLIANVAVHPDYRRQGIARALMEATMELVASQGGRHLLLQVEQGNESAINLYLSLGFAAIGSVTSWYSAFANVRPLPLHAANENRGQPADVFIRPLRRNEWRKAWVIDQASRHPDLTWPEPPPQDEYRRTFWHWLGDVLNGRQNEMWIAECDGTLAGFVSILSEWGRYHTLAMRVDPAWQGKVERFLLAKAIRRLKVMARRNIRIDHPAADAFGSALLEEANLQPRRTLTVMRFDFAG